jgi:hypothetical protein
MVHDAKVLKIECNWDTANEFQCGGLDNRRNAGVIFVSLQDSEELDWHVAVRGAATLKWLQPA